MCVWTSIIARLMMQSKWTRAAHGAVEDEEENARYSSAATGHEIAAI